MPASKPNPKARLRQYATGESYSSALQSIRAGQPVIAAAAPEQEQLEGAFLQKLAEFQWTANEGEHFGIKRVTPGERRIVLWLEDGSDITDLVSNVMPAKPVGHPEMIGIPGLRARHHDLGVSLYRPGIDAEIIIKAITVQQWETVHEDAFAVPHDQVHCAGRYKPQDWTQAELDFEQSRARFGNEALQREACENVLRSALLRRIGLFNRLSPAGVNTWSHIARKGVVVEVFQPDASRLEYFFKDLASPRLSPRFELMETDSASTVRRLTTTGNPSVLEIRIADAV